MMDTIKAFRLGDEARSRGVKEMVFDWDKAARLIVEKRPSVAAAGLEADWEWTGGSIWENDAPNVDDYTFLVSCWAKPELNIDGDVIECWRWIDESPGWDSDTKWPDSAIQILRDAGIL